MLIQPTIEKLYAMKLTGMAEAIRRQMDDPEASRLSFEERLALLVDQQWDWRQTCDRRLVAVLRSNTFSLLVSTGSTQTV